MKVTLGSNRTIKYVTRIGEIINSPEQRLILGATALATQPFIDLNNKKADMISAFSGLLLREVVRVGKIQFVL